MPPATTITIEHGAAPSSSASEAGADVLPHRVSAFDMVAATPWAMTPAMLETITAIARRENESPEAVEAKIGRPLQNARKVSMRGSVAVVPMTGPVFRYANLFTDISGATSLDVLAKDFTTALEDPNVSAIVLNIDSPGGQATGIAEFAQMVRASAKPVVAYVGDTAASAAYWIAAAANQIVMSKTAEVGSIGAVVAIDPGKKSSGVIEIVSSQSPKKRVDVNTDEGRAVIQTRIDNLAQVFVEDVATYRGVTAETVLANFGQGDMRIAADAVQLGMADSIGTLEEVIAGLSGKQQTKTAPAHSLKGNAMTMEELRAAHPDLCAALVEEGRIAGATAERQRIFDVEAQALPGHETLIAQFKADGATTGPMAAVAILAAERTANSGRAEKLAADAVKPVPHAAAPVDQPTAAAAEDKSLPLEDRAKAKWEASAEVRATYLQFDHYLAAMRAEEKGLVRVLGKTTA